MNSLLKYIVHKIWLITLLALVLVAVYVSLGRVMLPRLHQYQEPIKTYLSEKMGSPVYFEQLQGEAKAKLEKMAKQKKAKAEETKEEKASAKDDSQEAEEENE